MLTISTELHNHILNAELTLTEFGREFTPVAAPSLVKRWVTGQSLPEEPRLSQLAKILGTTVATLRHEPTPSKILNQYIQGEDMMNFDDIDQKFAELNHFRPLSKKQIQAINKDKKIEHVWSSNAIEGSHLNKYETAAILETGATIHGKSMADHLAAVDLSRAYDYMQDLALGNVPLDETTIRDLNRLVEYGNAKDSTEAGQYRISEVHPNGVDDVHYANPLQIPEEVQGFVQWSNTAKDHLHPVEYAALVHQKLVTIHPFIDGNGRTARLAMNFALTQHGYPVINIQPDKVSRDVYMETLGYTQRTNDVTPFVKLVADYTEHELDARIGIIKQLEAQNKRAKQQTRLGNFGQQHRGPKR